MRRPGHEVHRQADQESIFRIVLLGRGDLEVYLIVLDRLLRVTTKKRSSTFLRKKVHPQTKFWLRLWTSAQYTVQHLVYEIAVYNVCQCWIFMWHWLTQSCKLRLWTTLFLVGNLCKKNRKNRTLITMSLGRPTCRNLVDCCIMCHVIKAENDWPLLQSLVRRPYSLLLWLILLCLHW